jgi:hypothetical protein
MRQRRDRSLPLGAGFPESGWSAPDQAVAAGKGDEVGAIPRAQLGAKLMDMPLHVTRAHIEARSYRPGGRSLRDHPQYRHFRRAELRIQTSTVGHKFP